MIHGKFHLKAPANQLDLSYLSSLSKQDLEHSGTFFQKFACDLGFAAYQIFFTLARSPADLAYTFRQCLLLHQTLEGQLCHSYLTGALGPRDPIRGPKGTQGGPRGPKGTQGRLRRPWGGMGPWGPLGVIPKQFRMESPFRVEGHFDRKVIPNGRSFQMTPVS